MLRDNLGVKIIAIYALTAVFWPKTGTAQSINFSHLLLEDGIPSGGVSAVAQDQRGFIWLATGDGLRKYDGFEMRTVREDAAAGDLKQLRANVVRALSAGDAGVWYGTEDGLHFLQPDSGGRRKVGGAQRIRTLVRAPEGTLWAGGRAGLFKIEPGKGEPEMIADHLSVAALHLDEDSGELYVGTREGEILRLGGDGELRPYISCSVSLNALLLSADGSLWVATEGAGVIIVKDGEEQMRLEFKSDDQVGLPSNEVTCLFADSNHQLWIGTRYGLGRYDPLAQKLSIYRSDPDDPRTLPSNEIHCVFEDQRKVLWVGHSGGASRFPLGRKSFDHIRSRPGDPRSLSNDSVFGILVDDHERLWVGTEAGLNLRGSRGGFEHFEFRSADAAGAVARFIYVIHQAADGRLWLGTRGNGLILLDPETREHREWRHQPGVADSLPHNSITAIATEHAGEVWIGTSGGLAMLDENGTVKKRYRRDPANPSSLASNTVSDLLIDRGGDLYVATEDAGLMRLAAPQGKFLPVGEEFSPHITTLHEDRAGKIWIGTRGSGTYVYDPRSREIAQHLHTANSDLPSDTVTGILEDLSGRLWFSTSQGIARLDPATGNLRTFDTDYGLQSMAFNPNASAVGAGRPALLRRPARLQRDRSRRPPRAPRRPADRDHRPGGKRRADRPCRRERLPEPADRARRRAGDEV